ncbi:uncharacterized protein TRIREDRAFT_112688, partial [Trichoderma reesei QM6a]
KRYSVFNYLSNYTKVEMQNKKKLSAKENLRLSRTAPWLFKQLSYKNTSLI